MELHAKINNIGLVAQPINSNITLFHMYYENLSASQLHRHKLHIIPAFSKGSITSLAGIEHERDYYLFVMKHAFVFNAIKVNKVVMGLIIN